MKKRLLALLLVLCMLSATFLLTSCGNTNIDETTETTETTVTSETTDLQETTNTTAILGDIDYSKIYIDIDDPDEDEYEHPNNTSELIELLNLYIRRAKQYELHYIRLNISGKLEESDFSDISYSSYDYDPYLGDEIVTVLRIDVEIDIEDLAKDMEQLTRNPAITDIVMRYQFKFDYN